MNTEVLNFGNVDGKAIIWNSGDVSLVEYDSGSSYLQQQSLIMNTLGEVVISDDLNGGPLGVFRVDKQYPKSLGFDVLNNMYPQRNLKESTSDSLIVYDAKVSLPASQDRLYDWQVLVDKWRNYLAETGVV